MYCTSPLFVVYIDWHKPTYSRTRACLATGQQRLSESASTWSAAVIDCLTDTLEYKSYDVIKYGEQLWQML